NLLWRLCSCSCTRLCTGCQRGQQELNSPSNMSMSNQPGTPRDDGEMGGNFLNPFQSESWSVHNKSEMHRSNNYPRVRHTICIFRNA
uniref:Uncharacterized protein n=1 Tax=Chelonoidis abingdonii TaxID=106734 RepID=A0A8C0GV83_CHEAB